MTLRSYALYLRLFSFAALAVLFSLALHAQRLPDTVIPAHYALSLTPDLKAATFSGVESIDVVVNQPTKTVILNAIEIAFQSVTVTANGKRQAAVVTLDPSKEQATFTFPEIVPPGKAILSISYTGILNNELRGFYLSKTARRNYAVTQFESTDARRAYPSFDEPALKATYDVALTIDAADTAISNGPIASDTPGPISGKHTLKFLTSPKMSTYLVAFLVGDFQCSTGQSDGVAIRVCSTPDKIALTHYGVGVTEKVLHYYNQYFGIPYPLKKLDLIALPDFEAGAMENFGAITYRESELLLDEKTASVDVKKRVAIVIAHEMAHQWFGDLVTMQWWDNVWLNEGFANWMESKAVDHLHPEWKMDQDVAIDSDRTLNLDAQASTRTIRAKADTPDQINQMFDGIAYGKAGAVLLSIESYLGEETFRQGVHNYLFGHLYGNATAEDFWGAQTANSHKPVDQIMESLVAQPGVPLLSFGETADGKIPVTQKRFFLSPSMKPDPTQKWTLPVCFKTTTGQECQLLIPSETSLKIPTRSVFANFGGNGYYRSAYPGSVYAGLVSSIETTLTPTERIRLIGDELAQVRANQASTGDYMNLVAAVKADPNANVISAALAGFTTIYSRVAATPEEKAALSAWIRSTFGPEYVKLGAATASDSASSRALRAELFSVLGLYGKDPAVLAQARQIAQQYLADPGSVEPSLGHTALSIAAHNGDAALFDQLQNLFETTTNPEMVEIALIAFGQFKDPQLTERALQYAVSGKVRNQDVSRLLSRMLLNDETRDQSWKFIQEHWEKVQAQFTTAAGARVVGSTSGFCSVYARESVQSFFAAHPVAASNNSLHQALERIDSCIELRSLQEPKLHQWLAR